MIKYLGEKIKALFNRLLDEEKELGEYISKFRKRIILHGQKWYYLSVGLICFYLICFTSFTVIGFTIDSFLLKLIAFSVSLMSVLQVINIFFRVATGSGTTITNLDNFISDEIHIARDERELEHQVKDYSTDHKLKSNVCTLLFVCNSYEDGSFIWGPAPNRHHHLIRFKSKNFSDEIEEEYQGFVRTDTGQFLTRHQARDFVSQNTHLLKPNTPVPNTILFSEDLFR